MAAVDQQKSGEEMAILRWTSKDLERLPDDGQRYEIVGGELYVSKQPDIIISLRKRWYESNCKYGVVGQK